MKVLLLLVLLTIIRTYGQGNLYFRFDGKVIDTKQWYLNASSSSGGSQQEGYFYEYPCLLGSAIDPCLRTIDKNVFTIVPISQLAQYDVMTIQDFCQRCAATGSKQAENTWLKPYVLAYPNYKIFVVHINHANQTAKIVQVKWTAWQ